MLGKLIKHEFKAVNRLMIPMHLGLLIVSIIGRFYVQLVTNRPIPHYTVWGNIFDATLVSFYIIALMAVCIITNLYLCVLRPRKNLFTDEGYLMHTLPATASQHIWSKLVVAMVWTIADSILIIASVLIMLANQVVWSDLDSLLGEMIRTFPDVFGMSAGFGIPFLIVTVLVDVAATTLIIYMCIAIGHSFNSHKILSSVGVYAGVTVVGNIISSIFLALFGYYNFGITSALAGTAGTRNYLLGSLWFSLIYSVILAVAGFFVTRYFMSRRLNLE